jgi:hypothetical protein
MTAITPATAGADVLVPDIAHGGRRLAGGADGQTRRQENVAQPAQLEHSSSYCCYIFTVATEFLVLWNSPSAAL